MTLGNGMVYVYGVSDWSGQHLNTNAMQTLALLDIIQQNPVSNVVKTGFLNGMWATRKVRQPLFVISGFAFTNPGPEYDEILEDAIWSLREMPMHKTALDIDHRVRGDWCASPLPSLFWKFDWATGGRHQGIYGTPIFMRGGASCWYNNNPLSYAGGQGNSYDSGADFLHAYWLGKYFGVLDGTE